LEFQYNSCVKAPRSFAASSKALRIVRERLGYKASTAVKSAMELAPRSTMLDAHIEIQARQQAYVQST
jgi:hypothetical protein